MSASGRNGVDSTQATTWGNSLTRSYTRRLKPVLSRVKRQDWQKDADLEPEGGFMHGATRWGTLIMAYQCVGVVFGDLGTSPLYVFAGIFADENLPKTPENYVGAASLIIWTITALALIKYGIFVLRADDNGQGGSLALFSQLRRQGLLTAHDAERKSGGAGGSSSRRSLSEASIEGAKIPPNDWRQRFISAANTQNVLRVMVVLGVGLIMGDGVLTPAVTIVSAMEGLQVATSGVSRGLIVGLSCAIIAGLFMSQGFGPAKLGFAFSPILFVYFGFNSGIGIYNIVVHDASIFKALSPHYWFKFFLRNGHTGWRVLSGVLLCATGTEAMFADIGHFNRNAIRMGFLFVVYPSLVLMYLGQAAYLTKFPAEVGLAYFASLPGGKGLFWANFVVITAASIVASQALISASFAIVSQAITQGFFPRFRIIHTSKTHTGQIFIPVINYTLMTLTIIITVAFRTSARLSNAYGLAVICDMFLTTCFMTLILLTVWRKHPALAPLWFIIFGLIECSFLSASLLKVPGGAWFSLMMAGIYAFVMLVWFWGSNKKTRYFRGTQQSLGQFLRRRARPPLPGAPPVPVTADDAIPAAEPDESVALLAQPEAALQQLPGVGVFYSSSLHGVPHVLSKVNRMFPSLPQVCIFLTNRNVPLPEVLPAERLLVQQLGAPGFFHVIARYGYAQQISQGEDFVRDVVRHMQALLYRALCHRVVQTDALAPLASRRKLSRSVARVVNAAVGDIYGEGHPSPELTQRTVSNAHISLSTHGLSHENTRNAARRRPTILDEEGNLAWPAAAPGAAASAGNTAAGASAAELAAALAAVSEGSSSAGAAKRAARESAEAADADVFETEILAWGREMQAELDSAAAKGIAGRDTVEPLQRLAAELVLVAAAAQVGVLGYVMGRSHAMLAKSPGCLALPRRYALELPFQFLLKNTEQDMHVAYGIPTEKLLEVGLAWDL